MMILSLIHIFRRALDVNRKLRAQVPADMQRAAHSERNAAVRCAQRSQRDDVCVIDHARSDSVERQISIERVGCIRASHDHRIADRSADQHSERRFSRNRLVACETEGVAEAGEIARAPDRDTQLRAAGHRAV